MAKKNHKKQKNKQELKDSDNGKSEENNEEKLKKESKEIELNQENLEELIETADEEQNELREADSFSEMMFANSVQGEMSSATLQPDEEIQNQNIDEPIENLESETKNIPTSNTNSDEGENKVYNMPEYGTQNYETMQDEERNIDVQRNITGQQLTAEPTTPEDTQKINFNAWHRENVEEEMGMQRRERHMDDYIADVEMKTSEEKLPFQQERKYKEKIK